MKARTLAALAAGSVLAVPTAAQADVFNGRIAFSSFRASPGELTGDIYSINHDGTDLRLLTTKNEKEDDAQSDWAPDGRDIAYRIRKPGSPINFEVSRMRADGSVPTRLTFSEVGEASSQPTWWPDRSRMLFRVSGPGVSSMWTMNTDGKYPALLFDPPRHQFYPSVSPDGTKLLFSSVEAGATDRAIETMPVDGGEVRTLLDHPLAYDSAPAWSPDGTRIAFESNVNVRGLNPGNDMEIWVMDADGTNALPITHNDAHDEGPAWSPDGTMLAYSSGPGNLQVDIKIMTTAGVHLRTLTDYAGRDESPDWQPIPAPDTERVCEGDVRVTKVRCRKALRLAERWAEGGKLRRWDVEAEDFGGVTRVILTRDGKRGHRHGSRRERVVTFLHQPAAAVPEAS